MTLTYQTPAPPPGGPILHNIIIVMRNQCTLDSIIVFNMVICDKYEYMHCYSIFYTCTISNNIRANVMGICHTQHDDLATFMTGT